MAITSHFPFQINMAQEKKSFSAVESVVWNLLNSSVPTAENARLLYCPYGQTKVSKVLFKSAWLVEKAPDQIV